MTWGNVNEAQVGGDLSQQESTHTQCVSLLVGKESILGSLS